MAKSRSPHPLPISDMFVQDALKTPVDGQQALDRIQKNVDHFLVNYLLFYFASITILLSIYNVWYATLCNFLLLAYPLALYYNDKHDHIMISDKPYYFRVTFLARIWILLFIICALSSSGIYFLSFSLVLIIFIIAHSCFIDHTKLLILTNKPADLLSKLDAKLEQLERSASNDPGLQTLDKLEKMYCRAMKLIFMALFIIEDNQEMYNRGPTAVLSSVKSEIKDIKNSIKKALSD